MAIQKFFKNPTNSWQVTWGGGPCQQGRLAGKKASPLGPACPIRLPRLKGLSRPQVQVKSPPARAAVGQALVGQHRSRVLKVYSRWCLLAFEARINERLPWDLPPGWQSGASTPVLPRLGVCLSEGQAGQGLQRVSQLLWQPCKSLHAQGECPASPAWQAQHSRWARKGQVWPPLPKEQGAMDLPWPPAWKSSEA